MNLLTVTIQGLSERAENEGKGLTVTTHQVRNFFASTEKLKIQWQKAKLEKIGSQMSAEELIRALILMKPKLAYATARHGKQLVPFYEFIRDTIDITAEELAKNNTKENVKKVYENFIILMEGIVAYHKFKEKIGNEKSSKK